MEAFGYLFGILIVLALGKGIIEYFKYETPIRILIHLIIYFSIGLTIGTLFHHFNRDEDKNWFEGWISNIKWFCFAGVILWLLLGGVKGCTDYCFEDDQPHSEIMGDKSKYEGTESHGPQPYPGESAEHYLWRINEDSKKSGY